MNRRDFLAFGGASLLLMSQPLLAMTNKGSKPKKLVWVVLRGALDSLHTLVPTFDPHLQEHRAGLLKDIKKPLLPLANGYALHPALEGFNQLYKQGQLTPIAAVSSGYESRSHFDGQDFLESGTGDLNLDSGWLARASNAAEQKSVAISKALPISVRGGQDTSTWYPSKLKAQDRDTYDAILNMYQESPEYFDLLNKGLEQREGMDSDGNKRKGSFTELAKACGNLMQADASLNAGMLELNGWDTHNRQEARLNAKLTELDQGIIALQQELGEAWQDTLVVISTEFGRTVRENGTKGTDHGTASVMFLAGGAVNGGQILGTWPGLASEQLFQNRDLMPTSHTFDWISTALAQHWQLSSQQLQSVFPSARPVDQQLVKVAS